METEILCFTSAIPSMVSGFSHVETSPTGSPRTFFLLVLQFHAQRLARVNHFGDMYH